MKRTLLSVLILIFAALFAACATAQNNDPVPSWNDGASKQAIIQFEGMDCRRHETRLEGGLPVRAAVEQRPMDRTPDNTSVAADGAYAPLTKHGARSVKSILRKSFWRFVLK